MTLDDLLTIAQQRGPGVSVRVVACQPTKNGARSFVASVARTTPTGSGAQEFMCEVRTTEVEALDALAERLRGGR